ncbi:MAG: FAD:protein FMN transferase [Eubacteriales bacterium]|nr:FAD:protein FMN transferase [Eubacteriales bacterium]
MNRKKEVVKYIKICTGLVVLGVCMTACGQKKNQETELTRYTASFLNVFDTKTDMIGYAKNEEEFSAQAELVKKELTRYHELYDIYNSYEGAANIRTINEQAGIMPVKVDAEILDLLEMGKEMYAYTGGQVNIAMGSVLGIWHEYREQGIDDPKNAALPSMEALEEAASHTDIEKVIIDREHSTVYLEDPEMSLDVGGIGKGYAVQKVAEYAKELGMDRLLLSVGGNISANAQRIDDTNWVLGIQNPDMDSDEPYAERVKLADACVVTSGDYQRYYEVDGVRYCHIIDPDTLMPASYCASVSIITADSGKADALSTAVYNMPVEEGRVYVEKLQDVEAMWVLSDGSKIYTDGFSGYLEG